MDTWFETTGGTVRGAAVDGVRTFLGVPYGASTVGAGQLRDGTRWVEPWDGVRDALDDGPSSWQRSAEGAEQVEAMRQMLAMWGGGPEHRSARTASCSTYGHRRGGEAASRRRVPPWWRPQHRVGFVACVRRVPACVVR